MKEVELEEYNNPPYCAACKQPCDFKWEDQGVGETEYWGHKSVDHDWQPVSACCGEALVLNPENSEHDVLNQWNPPPRES